MSAGEEAGGVEIEVAGEEAQELEHLGLEHLGLRAFALLAPVSGRRFRFTNRIPLARGLGSSAATIALGLVGATLAAGRRPDVEDLFTLGAELEGHPDNVAAALAGGACLTWDARGERKVARVARTLPLVPIALVPSERVPTPAARAALPTHVAHADAAYTVARAALLGAGLASGDPALIAGAFDDRLHEPYRASNESLLSAIREDPPSGAEGATLSGSGPSVIVWAREETAASCLAELRRRFSREQVLPLRVSPDGAGPL